MNLFNALKQHINGAINQIYKNRNKQQNIMKKFFRYENGNGITKQTPSERKLKMKNLEILSGIKEQASPTE